MCWSSLQAVYQFLNCVDRPSKTRLMINNVWHAFSLTLPSRLLRVWCRKRRSTWTSLTKVSASRKSLRVKKHVPIGGKRHHTTIPKLHGKTRDLVAGGREEFVEGPTVIVRELKDVCPSEKITVQSHM